MERVLLGQLGANGDCLYATILARQLRHDFPQAEITWAISSQCRPVLANNPYVDTIWEVPIADWSQHEMMWRVFERQATQNYVRRDFDLIVMSQIWPNNFQNYDGTVRSSILRSYKRRITVPIENVICLTDNEIERVEAFAHEEGLAAIQHRILFECSSKSGQSFVTPDIAQDIADELYKLLPDSTVIFSTHIPMVLRDPRSRNAGRLSLREIAHLTHHVSLFVGCGSGGTVAASSTSSALLPMVQLLDASTSVFASFAHDFDYFGIENRDVLEMTDENPATVARCIAAVCSAGIAKATDIFGGRVPLKFDHYLFLIDVFLMKKHRYFDTARSLSITAERYGWAPELVEFARKTLLPKLRLDPSWLFARNRHIVETFEAHVHDAGAGALFAKQRQWSECTENWCS